MKQAILVQFWREFRNSLQKADCHLNFKYDNEKERWIKLSLVKSDPILLLEPIRTKNIIMAQIRFIKPESSIIYEDLYRNQRREIEAEIGSPLIWTNDPGKVVCSINLEERFNLEETSRWEWAFNWIIEKTNLFRSVFVPRLGEKSDGTGWKQQQLSKNYQVNKEAKTNPGKEIQRGAYIPNRPSIPVTGGLDIAKAFKINRARFIDQAITDAKKWCAPPWCLVGNKHSDQYWLNVFLAEPRSVTDLHVHDFLVSFQLARARKWDKQAVARRIILFSRQNIQDTAIAVEEFAVDLGKCIERFVGHQTSVASKIAFFSKPQQDVFIWDRLAKRSARFRDVIRLNESFGSLEQVGVNYSRYHSSCAAALAEERMTPDFCAAVEEFEKYIQTVGGPMADNEYVRKSSFLERRLLDKLMFCEGKFLEEAAGS